MKIIEVKGQPKQTCFGCPTVFEWEDKEERKFYFRLRHGSWRLQDETNDTIIATGETDESDGVCSWKEAIYYMFLEGVIVLS
ncbi:hypothetical protein P5F71_08465 [Clostridium perfringens]|nr:hypothetical protein [Clostridium perfringens]